MNNLKQNKYSGIPFKPEKFPFFYGWVILVLGIVGMLMSIPGQTMGVSVFTDDLIRVLKLSRVNLSLAYLIGTIGSALILTPAGKKLDKYGSRNIGTAVVIFLGIQLLIMSNLDKSASFLNSIFSGASFLVSFILITISFFLLRFLGQGMLTLISRNMVMKWFDKRRGMANAILGIFISFGFSLAPRVLNDFITNGGWNGAWFKIGLIILSTGTILFWLFSRDNPSVCGLKPDGNIKIKIKRRRPAGHPDKSFTLEQARKTLPFWVIGMTLLMTSLFVTAFTFHVVSIYESAGMSRLNAVAIFLPASFISVGVNFAASMISDYIKLRYILIAHIVSLIMAMFFLSRLAPGFNNIMFIIGYGFLGGLNNISNSVVWPRYYGTEHLGAISGMVMGLMVAGSAVGPYFFSLTMKISGSYAAASIICLAVMLVLFILAFRVRRPVHPEKI